jgi:hypothetical protein
MQVFPRKRGFKETLYQIPNILCYHASFARLNTVYTGP